MAKNLEFIESLKRNSHYKDWRYFIDGILNMDMTGIYF